MAPPRPTKNVISGPKRKNSSRWSCSHILVRYFDTPREARLDRRAAARPDRRATARPDNVWKDRNGDERQDQATGERERLWFHSRGRRERVLLPQFGVPGHAVR